MVYIVCGIEHLNVISNFMTTCEEVRDVTEKKETDRIVINSHNQIHKRFFSYEVMILKSVVKISQHFKIFAIKFLCFPRLQANVIVILIGMLLNRNLRTSFAKTGRIPLTTP